MKPESSTRLLITRHVQERFLYRLSRSPHAGDLVVKGGLLVTAVTDVFYRSTGDIDLQTRLAIAAQAVADDG